MHDLPRVSSSSTRHGERDRDETIRWQARLLEVHEAILQAIAESSDLDDLLERCSRAFVDHLGAALARIWLRNETASRLELVASATRRDLDGLPPDDTSARRFGFGVLTSDDRSHVTSDLLHDPDLADRDWARDAALTGFVGGALRAEGRVLGVLKLFFRGSPSPELAAAFETIARALAFAIERQRGQRALEEQARTLRRVTDSLPALIGYIDAGERFRLLNATFADWFQESPDGMIGLHIADVFGISGHERLRPYLREALDGRSVQCEVDLPSAWGSDRHVRANLIPQVGGDGSVDGFFALITDLSDLREAERTIRRAKEAAEEASHSKSVFLANMSHEIRTPMTAILGFSQELLDHDLGDEERDNIVRTILANGEHLLELINDVLDLSKIEAGKVVLERVACDAADVVRDVVRLLEVRARTQGIELGADIEPGFPSRLNIDPMRLRQILINLTGNAIKFTERGSVKLRAGFESEASVLRIAVCDTGIGMTSEQLTRLFRPFSQVDASHTRRYGGTGLGLSICKRLAELMGGEISVSSAPERGSEFVLRMPVADAGRDRRGDTPQRGEATSGSQECAVSVQPASRLDATVLVAEDNPVNQKLIQRILERFGCRVTIAINGREAVDLALARREAGECFDAVLMDMQMPVLDGYNATRELRRHGYREPIIALTAHAMHADRARCLDAGCDDYATKPIDRDALHESLSRLVKAREAAE